MDKVRKFDEMLREREAEQFLMMKVLICMLCGIGGFVLFLPFDIEYSGILNIAFLYLFGMAITFYLQPYMYIKEDSGMVSIYKLLEYMPVSKRDICHVRKEYLNRFCRRLMVVFVLCQLLTAALSQNFTIYVIAYPLVSVAILWGCGILYIRRWKK